MVLSSEDALLLQLAGTALSQNMGTAMMGALLYGPYALLACIAIHGLIKRPVRTYASWLLLAILFTTLVLMTTFVVASICTAFKMFLSVLVFNADKGLPERMTIALLANDVKAYLSFLSSSNGLLFLIGDGIVIWRAWAVWGGAWQGQLALIPCFLLLVNTGDFVAQQIIVHVHAGNTTRASPQLRSALNNLILTGYVLNVTVNLLATGLVAYRAVLHRRFINRSGLKIDSRASNALLLLTESGAFYSMIQLISLLLFVSAMSPRVDASALAFTISLWQRLALFISALYPVLVVLIVTHQRSLAMSTTNSGLLDLEQTVPAFSMKTSKSGLSAIIFKSVRTASQTSSATSSMLPSNSRTRWNL